MHITGIMVNDGHKSAIIEVDEVGHFQGISLPETAHFILYLMV